MSTYLTEFDIQDFDWLDIKPGSFSDRSIIELYAENGTAVTLWDEDLVIMCGGVVRSVHKGIGEFWMIPSVHIGMYKKSVFKTALNFIDDMIKKFGFYRLQVTIKESDPAAIRYIEHLGFEREGLMRKFGPDRQNYLLYARVK